MTTTVICSKCSGTGKMLNDKEQVVTCDKCKGEGILNVL